MDISKLSRLIGGIHRDVDLTQNTLVLENIRLGLGSTGSVTFNGAGISAPRTITVPDSDINLEHITNLQTLSGVAAAAEDLGTFTGAIIPDNSTIKSALQSLETAVENINVLPVFSDADFIIRDDADGTKQIAFEASGVASNSTRTITMPDSNVNLGEVNTSIQTDGSRSFTADQSMGSNKLTNLAAPTVGSDAANKDYVDNAIEGVKPKEAARAATTANITLSGAQTIDGVSIVAGDRVLVKNQTAPEENGIYIAAAGAWSRSPDFDELTPINEIKGSYVAVSEGTANGGQVWICNSNPAILDTDPINFVYFNSITTLNGGDGITITGTTIDVDHDGQGLQFVSGQLALELDGSTLSKSATGLKVADSGITATQLATDSVITAKIQNSAVDENKMSSSAFDQTTIAGGDGAKASVISAPKVAVDLITADAIGQDMAFAVRMARDSEAGGGYKVKKADNNASADDNFYVIGLALSTTNVAVDSPVNITTMGECYIGDLASLFTAGDIGKPVFLGTSGNLTMTAPTDPNTAVVRIGIVMDQSTIFVQPQVVGIN